MLLVESDKNTLNGKTFVSGCIPRFLSLMAHWEYSMQTATHLWHILFEINTSGEMFVVRVSGEQSIRTRERMPLDFSLL